MAPPDDCGGIYGYQELIEALGDSTHPQHAEMSEWWQEYGDTSFGPDFDPARLDLETARPSGSTTPVLRWMIGFYGWGKTASTRGPPCDEDQKTLYG